ncbi:MAG: hypothetical protein LUH18_04575 [Oscillospiraceae bacterium]|nr:hypothetical protein [Oscillospiraceae bacterium]
MNNVKENSGKIIKTIAMIVLVMGVVISVGSGIAPLAVLGGMLGGVGFALGFVAFIVVAGLGSLSAWITSTFIRGFGEIVLYTAESATYLEAIEKLSAQDKASEI